MIKVYNISVVPKGFWLVEKILHDSPLYSIYDHTIDTNIWFYPQFVPPQYYNIHKETLGLL